MILHRFVVNQGKIQSKTGAHAERVFDDWIQNTFDTSVYDGDEISTGIIFSPANLFFSRARRRFAQFRQRRDGVKWKKNTENQDMRFHGFKRGHAWSARHQLSMSHSA